MTIQKSILTPAAIEKLSTKVPCKRRDGSVPGMYVEVTASGSKLFRLKFTLNGKESRLSLGRYPDVSLAVARAAAEGARKLIAQGIHPVEHGKEQEAQQERDDKLTFKAVATLWVEHHSARISASTKEDYLRVLAKHAHPIIGHIPVGKVKLHNIVELLDGLASTPTIATSVASLTDRIMEYALVRGWAPHNVMPRKRGALIPAHQKVNHAAITDPEGLGEFLTRLDSAESPSDALTALRLLTLIPARAVEVSTMRWSDVDLEAALWSYMVSKRKRLNKIQKPHVVPLSRQALVLLRTLKQESAPGAVYVFPSNRNAKGHLIADNIQYAVANVLEYGRRDPDTRVGTVTVHGLRSSFRTLADEELGMDPVVLEIALSHAMPGVLADTYMRGTLLKRRAIVMQEWADYLDTLRIAAAQPE